MGTFLQQQKLHGDPPRNRHGFFMPHHDTYQSRENPAGGFL
jgi:hypothetical protein